MITQDFRKSRDSNTAKAYILTKEGKRIPILDVTYTLQRHRTPMYELDSRIIFHYNSRELTGTLHMTYEAFHSIEVDSMFDIRMAFNDSSELVIQDAFIVSYEATTSTVTAMFLARDDSKEAPLPGKITNRSMAKRVLVEEY